MRKYLERLKDERGSVGVLIALVLFTVVGMLFMTFNTAQLSKEKMRLQNAADAAALEHAIWQARSMNALQNLNDEGYVTCQTAAVCLNVGLGLEVSAQVMDNLGLPGLIIGAALHVAAVMSAGVSGVMSNIVLKFSIPISSFFFARVAVPIGYFSAQQYANANGATPILPSIDLSGALFGNMSLGFYAFGISISSPRSTFMLPVVPRSMGVSPYKRNNSSKKSVFTVLSSWRTVYKALGVANNWDFKPYVSQGGRYDKASKATADNAPAAKVNGGDDDSDGLEKSIQNGIAARRKETLAYRKRSEEINAELLAVAKAEEAARLENREQGVEELARKKAAEEASQRLSQELSDKKINIRANVDGEEWIEEARELVCRELKVDDPAKVRAAQAKNKPSDEHDSKVDPKVNNAKLPGATVWVAFKSRKAIHVMPLSAWSAKYKTEESALDRCPMIALAAAKCITGDLIPHNKKSKTGKVNQRPSGFGTGANAKLVPIQRALAETSEGGNFISRSVGSVIFH